MLNDWAHKMLDELGPTFYGEITFTVRAGEVRKVAKVETHVAPDIKGQRMDNLLNVKPKGEKQ